MNSNQDPLVILVRRIQEKGFPIQVSLQPDALDLRYDYFTFKEPVTIDLLVTLVSKEILVQGTLETIVQAECARCMQPVQVPLQCTACTYIYKYTGQDYQDISIEVRDELLLALPGRVLCSKENSEQQIIRFDKGKATESKPVRNNLFEKL